MHVTSSGYNITGYKYLFCMCLSMKHTMKILLGAELAGRKMIVNEDRMETYVQKEHESCCFK